MSFFVTCSFDLKDGTPEDYQNASADLMKLGFDPHLTGDGGLQVALPTTTMAGIFQGVSASYVTSGLIEQIKAAFAARNFKWELYLAAGTEWAWKHHQNKT